MRNCAIVSAVPPDFDVTMKTVRSNRSRASNAAMVSGSTLSRTCSRGKPPRVSASSMFQPLGLSAVRKAIGPSAEPPIPSITTSSNFPRTDSAYVSTCLRSSLSPPRSTNPTEPVVRNWSSARLASVNFCGADAHDVLSIPPGETIMFEKSSRSVMSSDFHRQAVEGGSDTRGQLRFELGMTRPMRQGRHPRLSRGDPLRRAHGLGYTQVRGMLRAEERVQNENVDAAKSGYCVVGQLFRIGHVAEIANAIAVDRNGSVRDRDRQHVDIADPASLARRYRVSGSLRLAGAWQRLDRIVEDVGKPLGQTCHRIRRTIHLDRHIAPVRERADVVDAVHVIGVIVREKNRVDLAHTRVDQLQRPPGRSCGQDWKPP